MSITGSASSPGSGRSKPVPSAGPMSWGQSKYTAKGAFPPSGIPHCWATWAAWSSISSCARTADEMIEVFLSTLFISESRVLFYIAVYNIPTVCRRSSDLQCY